MMRLPSIVRTVLVMMAIVGTAPSAWAQDYPQKAIRLFIGQSAGGAVDTVARLLAKQMSTELKQAVIVEYRPGASGMIAAQATATSAPDGYTLGLLDAGALAVSPVLQKNISYDVRHDFTYLGLVAKIPLVLAAHPSLQPSTLEELTTYLKQRPGNSSYASSGVGGPLHLAMETYKQRTGTEITHVPYQGGAPALTAVVGNHVPLLFIDTNLGGEYARAGKLKLVAVATTERNPKIPDVPTFGEAGITDFEFAPWVGLTGPADMPEQVVQRLTEVLDKVVAGDELATKIRDVGLVPTGSSGKQFTSFVASELDRYRTLIQERKISLNE